METLVFVFVCVCVCCGGTGVLRTGHGRPWSDFCGRTNCIMSVGDETRSGPLCGGRGGEGESISTYFVKKKCDVQGRVSVRGKLLMPRQFGAVRPCIHFKSSFYDGNTNPWVHTRAFLQIRCHSRIIKLFQVAVGVQDRIQLAAFGWSNAVIL